ncbi:MAG: gliding motility-associated C-terminal domain-containing protein [Saprospiraceae bacterium]
MRLLLILTILLFQQYTYAQPANDDCSGIINLGEAPSCPTDIYNNIDATPSNTATNPADNIPSCWTNVNNDVWFSFDTPVDGSVLDVTITVGGAPGGPNNMPMIQPQVAVYRGDCLVDELSELVCAEYTAGQSVVTTDVLGLDPATTYFIRVNDFSATATANWGDFLICVDSLSNAVDILATASADSICAGSSTQLNATGVDNVDLFFWEPGFSLSDPNSPTPNAFPFTTTTYTLTATNYGNNLITNGDFEMGDVSFTTDYVLGYDSLPQQVWGPLGYEGTYVVLDDPQVAHSNFAPCGDHTSGTGNMMIVNGSGVAGESLWCQTVLVEPNTEYQFSAWVATMVAENPANLQFSVNGILLGTPFTAPFFTCDWTQFASVWNSGVAVNAEICISNQNVVLSGNDFAIDDINFSTFSEGESSVTIYVSDPVIDIDNVINATCTGICNGSAEAIVTGGFTNTGYSFLWSDGQTTPIATDLCAGTYNITITDAIGCTATQFVMISETEFSVAVNEVAAPACEIQQDADVFLTFGNGTAPFTINWSSGGTGETEEGLTNGQYSVTVEDADGCTDIQTFEIALFEGAIPTMISVIGGDTICAGELITLTASGGNTNNYIWEDGSTDENRIESPDTETTYTVTTTTTGQNIIVNGDFEQGNVGFTSDHNFHQLPSNGMCEGCYGVAPSPPALWTQCDDNTTGSGNQMVFNAATSPGLTSWCQTVTVSPNTDYDFTYWAQTINSGAEAILSLTFDGGTLGNNLNLGGPCQWLQSNNIWNSGVQTSLEICINNLQTNGGGNDFALDDISMVPLCTTTAEKTISVSELNASIINQTNIGCDNPTGTASVFAEGGFFPYSFLWDDGNTGAINEELTGGIHTVTVSDLNSYCEEVLPVEILESPVLEILDVLKFEGGCDPANGIDLLSDSILIEVVGGVPPYQYSIDEGVTAQSDPLFNELSTISNLNIWVSDDDGCIVTANTPPVENITPTVSISAIDTFFCGEALDLSLNSNLSNPDSISWSTGEDAATISIENIGQYQVSVWDSQNCIANSSIEISECGKYVIPNAFTPDGDGENDLFGIVALGNVRMLELVIYNRWGEEVYKGNEAWNGMNGGSPHPMDVLIYRMEVEVRGEREVVDGNVTLLR